MEPFWGTEYTRSWADHLNEVNEGIKPYCAFDFSSFDSTVPKHNDPKHNFKDILC